MTFERVLVVWAAVGGFVGTGLGAFYGYGLPRGAAVAVAVSAALAGVAVALLLAVVILWSCLLPRAEARAALKASGTWTERRDT